jgi:hypothetical protein
MSAVLGYPARSISIFSLCTLIFMTGMIHHTKIIAREKIVLVSAWYHYCIVVQKKITKKLDNRNRVV